MPVFATTLCARKILPVWFVCILAIALVNAPLFFYPTLIAFYGFGLGAALAFVAAVWVWHHAGKPALSLSVPLLLFTAWSVYGLLRGSLGTHLHTAQIYSLCLLLWLGALWLYKAVYGFPLRVWLGGMVLLAVGQAGWCVGQAAGGVPSQNPYFAVTGSWVNPNVTALFLTMALPALWYLAAQKRGWQKTGYYLALALVGVALLLLQCRTAWLGAGVAALYWLFTKHAWVRRHSRYMALVLGLVLIPLGAYLYRTKQASADGRLLIWKITALMLGEKPLTGQGYGGFEKAYNLAQARYIASGQAMLAELHSAAPVQSAYNEYLQHTLEGGLAGGLLFIAWVGSLLYGGWRYRQTHAQANSHKQAEPQGIAYAAIAAFAGMSAVNFTVQAIPVMVVLIGYIGMLSPPPVRLAIRCPAWLSSGMVAGCVAGAVYAGLQVGQWAQADYQVNRLLQDKEGIRTEKRLAGWQSALSSYASYWRSWAQLLYLQGDYPQALLRLEQARVWSAHPALYVLSARCHARLGQYPQAIACYEQAICLHPAVFSVRYELWQLCLKTQQADKARLVAADIVNLPAKHVSPKVDFYKQQAWQYLNPYTN